MIVAQGFPDRNVNSETRRTVSPFWAYRGESLDTKYFVETVREQLMSCRT